MGILKGSCWAALLVHNSDAPLAVSSGEWTAPPRAHHWAHQMESLMDGHSVLPSVGKKALKMEHGLGRQKGAQKGPQMEYSSADRWEALKDRPWACSTAHSMDHYSEY